MDNQGQLYFTRRALNTLERSANFDEYQRLQRYFATELRNYPLQGKLLLNRASKDPDINLLRHELALRFKDGEVRELLYEKWLIIYLNYRFDIYCLDFISVADIASDIISAWSTEESIGY